MNTDRWIKTTLALDWCRGWLHNAASTSELFCVKDNKWNTRVGVPLEPTLVFQTGGSMLLQRCHITILVSALADPAQMDHLPLCRSCRWCLLKVLVPGAAALPTTADKRNLGTTAERSCVPCGQLKVCLPLHLSALTVFNRPKKQRTTTHPHPKKPKTKPQNQIIFWGSLI